MHFLNVTFVNRYCKFVRCYDLVKIPNYFYLFFLFQFLFSNHYYLERDIVLLKFEVSKLDH
jgi:hypothetical protein